MLSETSPTPASSGQCARPRSEIRPAVDTMTSDYGRLAAIHGGDGVRDLLGKNRLSQQRQLRVEDYAGSTAGHGGGGTMPADSARGPNRHFDRWIDK